MSAARCALKALLLPLAGSSVWRIWVIAAVAFVAACGGGSDVSHLDQSERQTMGTCDLEAASLRKVVYVSARGSDTQNCGGTTATACQTVQKGLAQCDAAGCGVLVRHGLYTTTATIELRDGVSVFGACRFDGEPDRGYRTIIEASPKAGTPAISAAGMNSATVMRGLVVIGKNEIAAGTASLVMLVSQSPGLAITANVLVGGRGGDGAAGAAAGAPGVPGAPGVGGDVGGAGGESCAAATGGGHGNGGQGGTDVTHAKYVSFFDWDCRSSDNGAPGQASGDGKPGGALGLKGAHGIACGDRPHDQPGDGVAGRPGLIGACGVASHASPLTAGRFNGNSWVASQGSDGSIGAVGSGGGGGGAGGACISETEGFVYTGLTGGGGGAGGCGGGGGDAGQQGGASIPLVLADTATTFSANANVIVPGPGGRGGRGGDASVGGTGGTGGAGRSGPRHGYLTRQCPGASSMGGPGGEGGAGSAGSGGHGGPSVGIAVLGHSAAPSGLDAVYAPLPGLPSRGGVAGGISPGASCSRTIGADGVNGVPGFGAATFDFNKPPGGYLAGGEALRPGQTRSSLSGRYQLIMREDRNFCVMKGSQSLWCSVAAGFGGGDELFMQTDGNLCLYTGGGHPACSNTSGHPGAFLLVRDDGKLAVSDGVSTLWASP